MAYAAGTAIDLGVAEPDDLVCCSDRIALTGYQKTLELYRPFDEFNKALDIISKEEDFHAHKKLLEEEILEWYNSSNFYCEIFEQSIFNIDGFVMKRKGKRVFLQFFSND